ncbi:hypothetical protein [Lysobacter auxotrophicus]|uniref:Transporter n=1 Tax=Lysobacter auxotrophicus TaxID=2992573 RepID=A0ABM8DEV1_9GAMM|nr:hypothetical protein [Lysobacter auxotrophicus]BDU17126.1 transporter [Lysobacter auxotrophicus]
MAVLRSTSHRAAPAHALSTVAGLALGLLAVSAHADTGVSAEPDVRFTGPLATGGPPLPKGLANVEPYLINTQVHGVYDEHGDRHHVDGVPDGWALVVPMGYGLTDRLGVGATFSANDASTVSGGRKWELGDTSVSAGYLLASGEKHNSSLTATIKQNIPSGQADRLHRHGLAEATGTGAATTQLSLSGQAYFLADRNLRGRFSAGWRLPGRHASLDGDSGYGTPEGFRGQAELHAASHASIGLEYSFNPEWVVATDVIYEQDRGAHVRGIVTSSDGVRSAYDTELPMSWRVSLAPAVEYNLSDKVGVIAGAQVSLDGRNAAAIFAPQIAVNMVF